MAPARNKLCVLASGNPSRQSIIAINLTFVGPNNMNPTSLILLGILIALGAFFLRRKPQHIEIFLDRSGSMPLQAATDAIIEMLEHVRGDTTVTFNTFALKINHTLQCSNPLEAAVMIKDALIIGQLASPVEELTINALLAPSLGKTGKQPTLSSSPIARRF